MAECRIHRIIDMREASIEELMINGVVFFGERHAVDWIIRCEARLVRLLSGHIRWVGLEMFNYRMQELLDDWVKGSISWNELVQAYTRGREGFPLEKYRPLLEAAASTGLRVVGVMPPREDASRIAREGLSTAVWLRDSPVNPAEVRVDYRGYRENFLKLMPKEGPMTRLNPDRLVEAQAYKDAVIARMTSRAYRAMGPGLVVAGWAHVAYGGGAPTRFAEESGATYAVVVSLESDVKRELSGLAYPIVSYVAVKPG